MEQIEGCQIPCLPRMADGLVKADPQPLKLRLKRLLARPWNYLVKKQLKMLYSFWTARKSQFRQDSPEDTGLKTQSTTLQSGDRVRVRNLNEIKVTLNPWKELKGCAFLPYMQEYCGTTQTVLQPVERFLDERDYKVKRCKGVVLLQGVICQGTPVFGRCDRGCHLFWRVEWLEKIEA